MYIRYALASTARPATKRVKEKVARLYAKMVEKSPRNPHQLANITAFTLPILSPSSPKIIVPNMEPTKKNDCPTGVL